MTARTSNLNPHIPMRVRGGFSLLQGGAGQGMGDLQCDQDGNCYNNGVLVSAPLTSAVIGAPGSVNPDNVSTTNIVIYILGGIALLTVFDIVSGGKLSRG